MAGERESGIIRTAANPGPVRTGAVPTDMAAPLPCPRIADTSTDGRHRRARAPSPAYVDRPQSVPFAVIVGHATRR